jgi:dynein heavy chain, axonemal
VDATVRELAGQAKLAETRVMALAGGPSALEALQQGVERLKLVNQGVVRYLGVKRRAFPRFFFLSNEELLTVLSAAPHLDRVAALCLSKIFEAAHGAEFDAEQRLVLVTGRENLRVQPVEAAAVEKWLVAIEAAVAAALKVEFARTLARRKELGRTEWAADSLLQLLLVAATAAWTAEVEASLRWPKKMARLQNQIQVLQIQTSMQFQSNIFSIFYFI